MTSSHGLTCKIYFALRAPTQIKYFIIVLRCYQFFMAHSKSSEEATPIECIKASNTVIVSVTKTEFLAVNICMNFQFIFLSSF